MVLVGKLYSVPVMRQTLVVRTCPVQCDHLLTYDRTRFEQIKATASVAGLEFEEPEYKHYEDNKKPEFIAKFPHGKIPALECTNGLHLTEGAAIARYRTYPISVGLLRWWGGRKKVISTVIPVGTRCRQIVVFLTSTTFCFLVHK